MRTGYRRQTWDFGSTKEVEEKHTGRYGARGQKREKRRKATPLEIAAQNQRNREKRVRRLIKWNFPDNSLWCTLTYPKGERPGYEGMRRDVQEMIRKLRRKYAKAGQDLKYIYRAEVGRKGGPHVHILVNRIEGEATDQILEECWGHGFVNFRNLKGMEGGARKLAEYICKPMAGEDPEGAAGREEPEEAAGQEEPSWPRKTKMERYHTSRNLIRRDPEEKVIHRRSLVDKQGHVIPPTPPKGWYIEPGSVYAGRNPVTGFFYRHYTLVKLDRRI